MEGWWNIVADRGTESLSEACGRVEALGADVRRQGQQLTALRGHALAISSLSWDSPAGMNFRSYLTERCRELTRSIDLLDSAAYRLDAFARVLRDAAMLERGAGS